MPDFPSVLLPDGFGTVIIVHPSLCPGEAMVIGALRHPSAAVLPTALSSFRSSSTKRYRHTDVMPERYRCIWQYGCRNR
jgi:hypothetical protein